MSLNNRGPPEIEETKDLGVMSLTGTRLQQQMVLTPPQQDSVSNRIKLRKDLKQYESFDFLEEET